MLGLDFHLISIYCLHHALYKIHTWKLFVYGKIFARGKIKIGRKSLGKKEKKTGPKKKERVPFCQEKKKNPLLKWLRELHAGVQISNKEVAAKPKFAIHEGHYCVVLLNASLSDREKKGGLEWVTFPTKSLSSSLTPGGLVVLLVCGFRRRDNLLAWRELLANL